MLDKTNSDPTSYERPIIKKSTSNYVKTFKHLSIEEKQSKYIISSIETVYLNLKHTPKYFNHLILLIFLLTIFNECLIWNFKFMFSNHKQYIFCYDEGSNTMELTDSQVFCKENDNTSINIYLEKTSLHDKDFIKELTNINRYYRDIFFNIKKITPSTKPYLLGQIRNVANNNYNNFKACIIFTSLENMNFSTKFYKTCSEVRNIMIFGIFLVLGGLVGNFILSFLADIYGRKFFLLLGLILVSLGSISIFILTTVISNKINTTLRDFRKGDYDTFIYENLVSNLYSNKIVHEIIINYEILYACFFFICICGKSIITNTSLCLILEFSTNDDMVYRNYLHYYSALAIAFLLSFVLNFVLQGFEYSFLIIGIFNFIFFIVAYIYILESPRHYYEFSMWENLTKIINSLAGDSHDLDKLYVDKCYKSSTQSYEKYASEKQKMEIKKSFTVRKKTMTAFGLFTGTLSFLIKKSHKDFSFIIKQEEILKNPLILFTLLFYEKRIRSKFLIYIALALIALFIESMIKSLLVSSIYFQREKLYDNIVLNTRYLNTTIFLLISNYLFNIIQKFFGFRNIMIICFPVILIFSMIYQIFQINFVRNIFDLNKYDYTKINLYFEENTQGMLISFIINSLCLFINGLIFSLFIYLTRFSKSIYRCIFIGLFNFLQLVMTIFVAILNNIIRKSFLLIIFLSFIGSFLFFFIYNEDDSNIITDKKILEINSSDE